MDEWLRRFVGTEAGSAAWGRLERAARVRWNGGYLVSEEFEWELDFLLAQVPEADRAALNAAVWDRLVGPPPTGGRSMLYDGQDNRTGR